MRKANHTLARAVKLIDDQKEAIRKVDADVDLYLHLFKNGELQVKSNLDLARAGKLTFAGVPVAYTPNAGSGVPVKPFTPVPVRPANPVFQRP